MLLYLRRSILCTLLPAAIYFAAGCGSCDAQNVVALVNDEPITAYDLAQRERWMARTSGFGDRMKALLTGDSIKEKFKKMMIAANPRSQAEAQQAAERIKKQLIEDAKRRVLSEAGGSSRKTALDAIIDDKLKIQAAKNFKIAISDTEVEENLKERAKGGDGKVDLEGFYKQFEVDGINRKTIMEIIRAQLAWRDVIRRQYGPRLQSLMSQAPAEEKKTEDRDVIYDVRVLRLAVSAPSDQKAVSQRILEAENLREKFTTCAALPNEAKLVAGASVKAMEKAKFASFPKDIQPLIKQASDGQMTPPVLIGNAIESYALCKRSIAADPKAKPDTKPDARMQEYDRFSKRYLQELRQAASIDYKGT